MFVWNDGTVEGRDVVKHSVSADDSTLSDGAKPAEPLLQFAVLAVGHDFANLQFGECLTTRDYEKKVFAALDGAPD